MDTSLAVCVRLNSPMSAMFWAQARVSDIEISPLRTS